MEIETVPKEIIKEREVTHSENEMEIENQNEKKEKNNLNYKK